MKQRHQCKVPLTFEDASRQERTVERSLEDDHLADLPLTSEEEELARNRHNAAFDRAGKERLATRQ
jgi:hypothetical protein